MKPWSRLMVLLVGLGVPVFALSQSYPSKPVRFIIPFAPGGGADLVGRLLGQKLTDIWGQPVVIDNRPGAGANIAAEISARAAPDGYTVLIHHIGMSTSPALFRKLDYDPLADFETIGLIGDSTSMLLARRDFPANDLQGFIAFVKANKDKLSFASTGPSGGPPCALLFMNAIQTEILEVVYKSTALGMTELIAGRVDMMCDSVLTATPYIKAGRVKVIGATSKYRSRALPDVPTLEEQGLAGFELANWMGLYTPKNTPRDVRDRLVSALQASLRDPDLLAVLNRLDLKVATQEQATPAALAERLKSETEKWRAVFRKAGIQPN